MRLITFISCLLLFGYNSFSQNKFDVTIEGLAVGDSIRVILQKGVESQFQEWAINVDDNPVVVSFDLSEGQWALFLDGTGYYYPSSQLIDVPEDANATFTLTAASGENYSYTWQDDYSYVGHATQVYINEPLEIIVLNDTVPVPDDYSSIKLRNEYGVVLSDEEESWSMDDSYKLYKMFESLPFKPFGIRNEVDFESGENVRGIFTLSNDILDSDLELSVEDGVKIARVGKDAFTYATPQIVTIAGIKGKFYSKRLYKVIVNFITDFASDDEMVNWIAKERFGVRFMLPDQETEDLMGEDSSNFQEFFKEEKIEILAMFEELPDGFHKQQGLQYLVRRINGQDNPHHPNAAAIAWTSFNTIEWMSKAFTGEINDVRRLILHEKAHFLWEYSFDQELKDDWTEIGGWFEDPTSESGWSTSQTTGFVSSYAHLLNPNEDMAESIAFYLTNPDALLTVSVEKYEFIRDRIMHGTRYTAMTSEELTFTVYNLFPDYVFPGKVTKMEIDVTGEPEEDKQVTVRATLNSIHPTRDGAASGYIRLSSPSGTIHDIRVSPENGQALDSILVGTTTFSKLEKSGYWNLNSFRIWDKVGNKRFENTSTIGWKLYLDNPLEDVLPPSWNYDLTMEVQQGYFDPNYNTQPSSEENGVLMQAIKYAYTVYDNSLMNRTITRIIFPTLDDLEAEMYEKQIQGNPSNWETPEWEEDFDSNKNFEQYLAIPEWFPSGYYAVSMINMYDSGGNNSSTYFVNDTADYHIPESRKLRRFKDLKDSIYVKTLYPDYIKPELDLNKVTIIAEPTNTLAPNGETRVDITMLARDLSDYEGHESGVASVAFVLRDPLGNDFGFQTGNSTMNHPELDIYDFNPDLNSNWAVYNFDLVLPAGSAPGLWTMASADIRDKAGNIKRHSFVELVRFDVIGSDIELNQPLAAKILSDHVNASNVENISASISCSPCEGLNYIYTIYSSTGGAVVQGSGVFEADSIALNGINTSGVLDGTIMFTVQVTDTEDQLIATLSTAYTKDTFYPASYYSSSNIQDEGSSSLHDVIIGVVVDQQDLGGTYALTIENTDSSLENSSTFLEGSIKESSFNLEGTDFVSMEEGYFTIELIVTDSVGNVGEPQATYYLKENGVIYFYGTSLGVSTMDLLQNDVKVYPNPTHSIWQINSSKIITSANIYDLQGRLVISRIPNSKSIHLKSEELSSGVYIGIINERSRIRLIKK